jgi:signal transduction histidine kinase
MSTSDATRQKVPWRARAFEVTIIASVLLGGALLTARELDAFKVGNMYQGSSYELLAWILLIAAAELLPVPAWRGLRLSLGLPLLITVGILYPPVAAGVIAFLGSADPREFRRQTTFLDALFNRCQVALSVYVASLIFHAAATFAPQTRSAPSILIAVALLAASADYLVNSGIITAYVSLNLRLRPLAVIRQLRVGGLREFLFSYLGLGVLGLTLAVLYAEVGFWSIPAFFAPLLFARQMFLRSQALEEAHKELMEREQVLRALSNAMAEERADERIQIAGYLHDDLAQLIFRLSIQLDVARKMLDKGDLEQLGPQLDKIRVSKQETSDRIRALSRDLHRSPLGAKGLAEALESFTDEVGLNSYVRFHREVADIHVPAPIALLVYHIAREGVMNALKHAQATDVWITVREVDGQIELQLRDNGVGFDTSAPGPEGHFGMVMMRERAQIGGGTFDVESAIDEGATITVRFPISLLQLEPTSAEGTREGGDEGTDLPDADTPHPAHGRPEPHPSGRSPAPRASSRRH